MTMPFPGGQSGSIIVSVHRAKGDVATATISGEGNGFLTKTESKRHGSGLVRRLAEQVRGSLTVDSGHGAVWTIKIPVERDAYASCPPADRTEALGFSKFRGLRSASAGFTAPAFPREA
jgi:hypothetical protein